MASVGVGCVVGLGDRGGDCFADLLVDGRLGRLVEQTRLDEVLPEDGDRVLAPPQLDLFGGAVELVVVIGGVGVVAVGLGLDEASGPPPAAGPFDGRGMTP